MRVLLVEDDDLIGQGIVAGLCKHGIAVHHVGTAAAAEAAQLDDTFQALVLDLGLPDRDGMELMARMRTFEPDLPVLILSARDAIEHKLTGLQGGADDYLIKPFDLRELAARLHALVRRTQGRAVQSIEAGPFRLEPDSGLAWLHGEPVTLSRREVDLLIHLAAADGRWVLPDALSERLYGLGEEVNSNALNVHIHNIRRKLGAKAIETTRGLGYRLGWRPNP
ncbi:response regulator [Halopseudomonas bauzanensis]|uniref:Two component transcriptional regulator, winged helix family n=1 Tax=Halopseudomonas bauzanensis TaxID=653930 RepID=A0A1I4P7A7_9GAMM|nr:response regulator transcription factor [Halopseudomonas bauzanensis]SES26709.1 two component transcriptional regulator, winged helix family [Halopseudomonas bauzanensis]SFM23515.1 two component transcriptional regulator, winged helix family [Halopseudomonas bauzanensis]